MVSLLMENMFLYDLYDTAVIDVSIKISNCWCKAHFMNLKNFILLKIYFLK